MTATANATSSSRPLDMLGDLFAQMRILQSQIAGMNTMAGGCTAPGPDGLPRLANGCLPVSLCNFPLGPQARQAGILAGAAFTLTFGGAIPVEVHWLYIASRSFVITSITYNGLPRSQGFVPTELYNGTGGAAGQLVPLPLGWVDTSHTVVIAGTNVSAGAADIDAAFLGRAAVAPAVSYSNATNTVGSV